MPLKYTVQRAGVLAALAFVLAAPCIAQEAAQAAAAPSKPSTTDTKRADKLLNRALRLQSQPTSENLAEAVVALHEASALNPADASIATAEEAAKMELAGQHLERGNRLMEEQRSLEAATEFRAALALDPTNDYAAQRLGDAAPVTEFSRPLTVSSDEFASEPEVQPASAVADFSFKGDTRGLFENIGKAFGISMLYDESVQPRPVRFNIQKVDFFAAMNAAERVTRTFYVVIDAKHVLIAADSVDNRRKFQRMSLRTFKVPGSATPQEMTELMNLFRTMFDLRFVAINPNAGTITVRAPQQVLVAAEKLLADLGDPKPQVMLEVHALAVDHTAMRNIGVSLPLQFTIFNINTEARALLQSGSGLSGALQQLANGANLSPNDLAAAAALLAAQQGTGSSPLLKPFATFGGGITREGVNIPPASLNFSFNSSWFRSLQQVTLRAEQGNAATLHVGDRFPVLTQSFEQAGRTLVGRNVPQAPIIPAFSYEDLGITLKATPQVTGRGDVTLNLELQIKSLGGQSFNSIPTISNREYKGAITVKDGETSVMTGYMSSSEQHAVSGLPFLSKVPGLRYATASNTKDLTTNELLIIITPHVISSRDRKSGGETYITAQ